MLLALRSLWEGPPAPAPPGPSRFISRAGGGAVIYQIGMRFDHVASRIVNAKLRHHVRHFAPLLSGVMGDDIGFHDTVAGIVLCGQRVRVGHNVTPDVSHFRALAVDHFLVIVEERVAVPMRGAA